MTRSSLLTLLTGVLLITTPAVRSAETAPSPERAQHLRTAVAADSDLAAALSALEKNPGSARATHIVYKSLQQQAESLREFYLDRSL